MNPTPLQPSATAHADAISVAGSYLSTRRADTSILSMTFALQPLKVWANADDTISFEAICHDNGEAKKYTPVGDLIFRDPEGHALSFVRGADGKVEAMIADGVAEFEVEHGVLQGYTQVVLLMLTILILIASAVLWPVGALLRCRYGRPLRNELDSAARKRVWIVRGVVLIALVMVAMAGEYLAVLSRLEFEILSASNDSNIRVFQFMAVLVIVGSVYTLWRSFEAWQRREGSVFHRLGATATGCALAILAVFFLNYHILAIHLNF